MNVTENETTFTVASDNHPGVEVEVDKALASLADDRDLFLAQQFKRATRGLEA